MSELRQVSRARKIDGPLTPTYGPPIDHSSAWKVADFTTPADYTIELDATHLRDIGHAVRQLKAAGLGLDDLPERKLAWPTADPGSAAAVPANWIDPSIRDADSRPLAAVRSVLAAAAARAPVPGKFCCGSLSAS